MGTRQGLKSGTVVVDGSSSYDSIIMERVNIRTDSTSKDGDDPKNDDDIVEVMDSSLSDDL